MEFGCSQSMEIDRCWEITQEMRQYLKDQRIGQWQNEYPDRNPVAGDVMKRNGYVIAENGHIIDYACISFDKEECYGTPRGTWKSIQPYDVIHRLTTGNSHKGKDPGSLMLHRTEELCRSREIYSIKIDTDQGSGAMRHLLEKNGHEYCGVVTFDNSDKIASEKPVRPIKYGKGPVREHQFLRSRSFWTSSK